MTKSERYRAMLAQIEQIEMQAMVNASQQDRTAFPLATCYWALMSVMNRFMWDRLAERDEVNAILR